MASRGRPREAIVHGTVAGYWKEYRRGLEICDDCRVERRRVQRGEAQARYANQRRLARRGGVSDVVADYLEALTMQGWAGVPLAVLADTIGERHDDITVDTIRRTLYRMLERGEVVQRVLGDERRWCLNEAGPQ